VEENRLSTIQEANQIQINKIVRSTLQKMKNKTQLPQRIVEAVKAYEARKLKFTHEAEKHKKNRKLQADLNSKLRQVEKRFEEKEKKLKQEKKKALQNIRAKFKQQNGRITTPPAAYTFEIKKKRILARKKKRIAVLSGFLPREAF